MSPSHSYRQRRHLALGDGRDHGLLTRCAAIILSAAVLAGCVTTELPPPALNATDYDPGVLAAKLRRVGLELMSYDDAGVPLDERERVVPCRVIEDFEPAILPNHAAGYLLVGINRKAATRDEILDALRRWRPGYPIIVSVRRNPYSTFCDSWWESDVEFGDVIPPPRPVE